jgi:20S proteasome subunit alpha 6
MNTQQYGKRPYGVGLLVAGLDETGPHLFEFMPSGIIQEMLACAIGGRSQMARTYLERHLDQFHDASRDELIHHGLRALRESLSQDKELNVENLSIGVVGLAEEGPRKGKLVPFRLFDGEEVTPFIEASAQAGGEAEAEATETMQVDS